MLPGCVRGCASWLVPYCGKFRYHQEIGLMADRQTGRGAADCRLHEKAVCLFAAQMDDYLFPRAIWANAKNMP